MYRAALALVALGLRVCGRDPATTANAPVVLAAPPPSVAAAPGVVAPPPPLVTSAPAPAHGGRVQIVGSYAVETVAARTGGVAMFWTDLQGHPIPTDQVTMPRVRVDVNGRVSDVPVRVVNGAFVASVAVPAMAPVAVSVPHVVVGGVSYDAVEIPSVIVVAALPGIIVVPVVAPVVIAPVVVGWHGKHHKFHGHGRGHFRWH